MPSRLYNLARMTVASAPGTGNISLGAAVPGFLNFNQAGVPNLAYVRYGAKDGNAREVGWAQYSSGGNGGLLSRTIEDSTNGGAALNLSANAIISILPSAKDFGTIAPQCGRLAFSTATALTFLPKHGNKLKIAGKLYEIPAGGLPGLSNTGIFINGSPGQSLAASSIYFACAWVNAGVAYGGFTTDPNHAASQTVDNEGVEYSVGMGESYTILGMIRTNGSAQFDNMQTLSWFNRRFKETHVGTGNLSTTAGAWTNMTGNYPSIKWGDEPLWLMFSGQGYTSGSMCAFDIGVDFAGSGVALTQYVNAGASFPVNLSGWYPPAEGYHGISGLGVVVSGGGTASYSNSVLGWGTFG